jgi:O-antigen ligase
MTVCSRVVIALLAWGALSFGAVYPWGYWPLAAGCLAVGVWAIVVTRAWREPRPRRMALALAAVAAAIAVQTVPLPYHWFKAISPSGDAVLSQLILGWALNPPAWHALSLEPFGTVTALLLFVALAVLIVGLMRAISYMPIEWIVTQLTTFGLVMAMFGIVQRVVGGPGDILVYGFWKASSYANPFGPFINRNHFAGWMVMVLPLALAAASARAQSARGPFNQDWRGWIGWLATPDASRFVFTAIAIVIMAVGLVLSSSRSGLASIIVAVASLGVFAARQHRGRVKRVLPALYLALVVIVAVGWVGLGRTIARFEDARQELGERTTAWKDTLQIARDFPIAGAGLGGYGTAMLVYQTAERHSIYVQAHNDYLQVLAEGGALVVLPIMAVLGVIASTLRHRFRESDPPATFWLRAGATAGLIGIAAQSLFDLSLQMPGNAMMFAVLLAIALHRPSSAQRHADSV